jgi:hypothetical protein
MTDQRDANLDVSFTVINYLQCLYGTAFPGAMAYVYCSATTASSETRPSSSIIRSILRQLSNTDQELNFMKSMLQKRDKRDDVLTSNEAVACILQLIALYDRIQTTIVIGGLDVVDAEYACSEGEVQRVLQASS